MKNNTILLIIAVVLFIIIVASMCSACVVIKPYTDMSPFSKEFPYEGFRNLDYTATTSTGQMGSDINKSLLINKDTTQCKKVYGFDGLYCEPSYTANKQIDFLANTQGKLTCNGEGSGLSNSMGSLCFTPEQKKMLTTRGGNATGNPMEIGK